MARAEYRDEDLRDVGLAGTRIDDRHRVAGVIDEATLTGAVDLAHGQIELPCPASIQLTILAVLQAVRIDRLVLFPQQHQRDAFAAQLLMNLGVIGQRP